MCNKRIIFVDDDQFTAALSCEMLRDHGYSVLELHSAAEALDAIDAREPLFGLVTDINLGFGADGFEIARHARAVYADLPVVYISGLNAPRHASEGVAGSAFLLKPYDVTGIIEALISSPTQGDFDPTTPPRGAAASLRRPGVWIDGRECGSPDPLSEEPHDQLARIDGGQGLLPILARRSCRPRASGPASAPTHRRSTSDEAASASIRERSILDRFATDRPSFCILHVDDHPVNRRLVAEVLRALGHRSFEAACGAEALAQLKRQAFDLVLMDINMPGMSGIEVTRQLRNFRGAGRDTPVIALTSEVERGTADYAALGFDGYVAKPFGIAVLAQAIETCGRRRHGVATRHPAELLSGPGQVGKPACTAWDARPDPRRPGRNAPLDSGLARHCAGSRD
jgi:CheY-like chemotaxis protein